MQKRIVAPPQRERASPDQDWLHLEGLAEVEITSEDTAHPIEHALTPGGTLGLACCRTLERRRSGFSSPVRSHFGGCG